MTEEKKTLTTAQAVVAYRTELMVGGFTAEESFEMSRDAARELVAEGGLCVSAEVAEGGAAA